MDGSAHDLRPPPPPPPAAATEVLVVDDSAAQRLLMRRIVEGMGLTVRVAAGAAEALALMDDEGGGGRIGMIVSDWQMPGLDGPDFCRAVRERITDRHVYFILVTAGGAKAGGLDAGADDYVSRPVDLAELRARVRAGLRLLKMQENLLHRNHEVATTLHDLQAIQHATNQDLVEARKIQRSYLPADRARFEGGRLRLRLVTQGPVGGDLLGYARLEDGRLALVSIDVSGHGIASAMLTGRLAGVFGTDGDPNSVLAGRPVPPEITIGEVNQYLVGNVDSDLYFTIAMAFVDLETGEVELCQAGHPHPLIRRADGRVEKVGEGGPPVGLLEDAPFEGTRVRLRPGDTLFLYSDGLTECVDTWGEMLEEEGLIDLVASAGPEPDTAVDAIEAGLRKFVGIADFEDDVSMLHFRFDGPEAIQEDV